MQWLGFGGGSVYPHGRWLTHAQAWVSMCSKQLDSCSPVVVFLVSSLHALQTGLFDLCSFPGLCFACCLCVRLKQAGVPVVRSSQHAAANMAACRHVLYTSFTCTICFEFVLW